MQIIHAADKLFLLFLAYFLPYIVWYKQRVRATGCAIEITGVGLISAYGRQQFDLHAVVIKAIVVFEFKFYWATFNDQQQGGCIIRIGIFSAF